MAKWKHTINGIPEINDRVWEALEKGDRATVEEGLRVIGEKFRKYFREGNNNLYELEALGWFEESIYYSHNFINEYNYYLGELYNFADRNRIWVNPRGMSNG